MIFRQLFDRNSCTYTYLLADEHTLEGVIIDSVSDHSQRDATLVDELQIKLKYVLETHIHADHVNGVRAIRAHRRAQFALGKASQHPQADLLLDDDDSITFGRHSITAIATPGHTAACVTYACDNMIFSGDSLLIRGCGRTDFQEGDPDTLYRSVHTRLFVLPDQTRVYPGHDYNGHTVSTIGEEKLFNPRLKQQHSCAEFRRLQLQREAELDLPTDMEQTVQQNLHCL